MDNKIAYNYKDMIVELFDDTSYTPGSDNKSVYELYHFTDGYQNPYGTPHGVRLFKGDLEVNSCLLIGSGGTTVHPTSAILNGDSLSVCCGDSVFSLELPSLKLSWQTQVDIAACFQIYSIGGGYVIHGEVNVSMLNSQGDIIWSFSGCDIFVSPDGETTFAIHDDHIALVDWEKNKYELDFNGKVIRSVVR